MNDEEFVAMLDELAYKCKDANTELGHAFRGVLHAFLREHGLDWDQHMFARLPSKRTAK